MKIEYKTLEYFRAISEGLGYLVILIMVLLLIFGGDFSLKIDFDSARRLIAIITNQ